MTAPAGHDATAAYEVLRSQALGQPTAGGPALGLAVVFRQGLPGWLQLWAERMAGSTVTCVSAAVPPRPAVPLAAELALVLANMVLHTSQGQPA